MRPKLKPFSVDGKVAGYLFYCPGCQHSHAYYVGHGQWAFNGNAEKPSFTPSLLVFRPERDDPQDPSKRLPRETLCHLFLTDGEIRYCGDCKHNLSGQTHPMVDWPDWYEA